METIAQQRQEVVRLIESVSDPNILEAVKNLLSDSESVYRWKQTLNSIVSDAEKDISEGNVYSSEEFRAKIDAKLDGLK